MNNIRQIQALNKRELENAVYVLSSLYLPTYNFPITNSFLKFRPPSASWHADYRDTAYIYIGGLPYDLSEGDVVTICSQFGEPVHVNLVRDKETGKSRGFAFLKYEDQRSTDLAVDNLGGATVLGRILRVDHVRYKKRDDEEEGDNVARLMGDAEPAGEDRKRRKRRSSVDEDEEDRPRRPQLKEERELVELMQTHDEEDPMKEFLIEEKKEEVAQALERAGSSEKKSSRRRRDDSRERSSRHHRSSHRRRHGEDRSRSRDRRHRDRRSPSRERRHRDRSPSRRERSHRDRSPERSRSPGARRHRDRHDRLH